MLAVGGEGHALDKVGVVPGEGGVEFERGAMVEDEGFIVRRGRSAVRPLLADRDGVDAGGVAGDLADGVASIVAYAVSKARGLC